MTLKSGAVRVVTFLLLALAVEEAGLALSNAGGCERKVRVSKVEPERLSA